MRGTSSRLKPATAAITDARTASQKKAASRIATTNRAATIASAARHPVRTVMAGSMPCEAESWL